MQAGGQGGAKEIKTPAGLPKLFKSIWDWNLYTNRQKPVNGRQVESRRMILQ